MTQYFRRILSVAAGLVLLSTLAVLFAPPRQGIPGFHGNLLGSQLTFRVTSVTRGGPAERAGIKTGDVVSFPDTLLFASPGDTMQALIQRRSASRIAEIKLAVGGLLDPVLVYSQAIVFMAFVGIGLLIGLRRADSRTARWLAVALVSTGLWIEPHTVSVRYVIPVLLFDAANHWFSAMAWIRAVAIFPKPAAAGLRPWIDRHAYLLGIIWAIPMLMLVAFLASNRYLQMHALLSISSTIGTLLFAFTIILSIVDCLRVERGQDRQRVFWALFGIGIAALALLARAFVWELLGYAWGELLTLGLLAVPITLAYSILRYRVLDIRIALNKTLLYGALTGFILVAFVFVETLVERTFLSGKPGGTVIEIVAVLAVGLSLRPMHDGMSELLDSLMFRQRRRNVAALSEFAELLPSINDLQTLRTQTIATITECTESAGCAIFERDGETYVARCSRMPDAPATLARTHPLVQKLESTLDCVDVEELSASGPFAFAAPMDVHGELAGFVALGPKRDGDRYDKLERAVIERIAHGVGRILAMPEGVGL
jgi:hypothetical protein